MMMRCAPPLKHSVILITVQGGPTSVKLHFGSLFPGAKSEKEEKFLNNVKVTFAKMGTSRHYSSYIPVSDPDPKRSIFI
jgi:hypothetical protein